MSHVQLVDNILLYQTLLYLKNEEGSKVQRLYYENMRNKDGRLFYQQTNSEEPSEVEDTLRNYSINGVGKGTVTEVAKLLNDPSHFFKIRNFLQAVIKYVFKRCAKKVLKFFSEIMFIENT